MSGYTPEMPSYTCACGFIRVVCLRCVHDCTHFVEGEDGEYLWIHHVVIQHRPKAAAGAHNNQRNESEGRRARASRVHGLRQGNPGGPW